MGRVRQPEGSKGSLKWTQALINEYPSLLNRQINKFLNRDLGLPIVWLSPIADDDYAEYRDEAFLDLLGIDLTRKKLKDFWPKGGPQWDALGRDSKTGEYFLVEAKANIPELLSDCQANDRASLVLIKKSLLETQNHLNCKFYIDWIRGFYQYANRVAHLYYLRCLNNEEAYLVFVYFINDVTHIPTFKSEWDGAIRLQRQLLFLGSGRSNILKNQEKMAKNARISVLIDEF